jgi:hypothetical protein
MVVLGAVMRDLGTSYTGAYNVDVQCSLNGHHSVLAPPRIK